MGDFNGISKKTTLGIIGGSGPQAGINVMELILSLNRKYMGDSYQSDKDAVSIVMMQEPGVGGPHGTWDLEEPNSDAFRLLWRNMTSIIKKLHLIDVEYFCITCNTLHYLEPLIREWMISENIKPTFISIVEVTKSVVVKHYKKFAHIENGSVHPDITKETRNRVAVLGNLFTTDLEGLSPYVGLFKADDVTLDCVALKKESRYRLQQLIEDTKRDGPTSNLQNQFFKFLEEHYLRGTSTNTDYIVLGCTELPILLTDDTKWKLENSGIVVIDPNAVLAEEMLRFGGYIT